MRNYIKPYLLIPFLSRSLCRFFLGLQYFVAYCSGILSCKTLLEMGNRCKVHCLVPQKSPIFSNFDIIRPVLTKFLLEIEIRGKL